MFDFGKLKLRNKIDLLKRCRNKLTKHIVRNNMQIVGDVVFALVKFQKVSTHS